MIKGHCKLVLVIALPFMAQPSLSWSEVRLVLWANFRSKVAACRRLIMKQHALRFPQFTDELQLSRSQYSNLYISDYSSCMEIQSRNENIFLPISLCMFSIQASTGFQTLNTVYSASVEFIRSIVSSICTCLRVTNLCIGIMLLSKFTID